MSEPIGVYVCGLEYCENRDLYGQLCTAAEGKPVNLTFTAYCLRLCRPKSRVDVHAADGMHRYAREELIAEGRKYCDAIGNDPVKTLIDDHLPK